MIVMTGESLALEKVTLQLRWDHQFQFAGYYAAKWQGYYKEAGLDVEIRSAVQPGWKKLNVVKEISEGRAHFGVASGDALIARDQGIPLVVIATIFQRSATRFFSAKDKKLATPADFLNLRVARIVNDMLDVELQATLMIEGIDPTTVKAYPQKPGFKHLANGDVDVIPGYTISLPYSMKKAGYVNEHNK